MIGQSPLCLRLTSKAIRLPDEPSAPFTWRSPFALAGHDICSLPLQVAAILQWPGKHSVVWPFSCSDNCEMPADEDHEAAQPKVPALEAAAASSGAAVGVLVPRQPAVRLRTEQPAAGLLSPEQAAGGQKAAQPAAGNQAPKLAAGLTMEPVSRTLAWPASAAGLAKVRTASRSCLLQPFISAVSTAFSMAI